MSNTQIAQTVTVASVIAAGFSSVVANAAMFGTHGDYARAMLEAMAKDIKETGTFVYTSRCPRYYDSQKVGKVTSRVGKVYDAGSRSIRAAITEEIAFASPSVLGATGTEAVQHVQKGVGVFQKVINAVLADEKSSADLRLVAKFCKDNLKRKAPTTAPATEAKAETESQTAAPVTESAEETKGKQGAREPRSDGKRSGRANDAKATA